MGTLIAFLIRPEVIPVALALALLSGFGALEILLFAVARRSFDSVPAIDSVLRLGSPRPVPSLGTSGTGFEPD